MAYKTISELVEDSKCKAVRNIDVMFDAFCETTAELEALKSATSALMAEIDSYDWAPGELPDDVQEALQKLRELV